MRVRVLPASSRLKGVMVGLILEDPRVLRRGSSAKVWLCGDEPGAKVRQHETDKIEQREPDRHHPDCSPKNDAAGTETEPILKDVMSF